MHTLHLIIAMHGCRCSDSGTPCFGTLNHWLHFRVTSWLTLSSLRLDLNAVTTNDAWLNILSECAELAWSAWTMRATAPSVLNELREVRQ